VPGKEEFGSQNSPSHILSIHDFTIIELIAKKKRDNTAM